MRCAASGREAAFAFVAASFDIANLSVPERIILVARELLDAPDERPIGWISSWSSRAPPSFC